MFNSSSKFQRRKNKKKGNLRQLFRATDFESLLYPCFTFSRFLGLFPHKFNGSTITVCKPSYILSVVIVCGFIFTGIWNLCQINVYKNVVFKHNLIRLLDVNSFYIFGGFIVVIAFITIDLRRRFLQTLLDQSSKLPPATYQSLSRIIHFKDIFGTFFLLLEGTIIYIMSSMKFIRIFFLVYCELVRYEMDMLFVSCVCLLKACFKKINDDLMHLRELVGSEPYILTDTYYKHRVPFLLLEITALKRQHQGISNVVQMIKMVFSLQIVFTILLSAVSIVFNMYFVMTKIQKSIYLKEQEKEIYQDYSAISIVYDSARIIAIVCICETAKNQAMEIKSTIHQVFNRTSNKQIKYELRLFSLQLMHRKNVFAVKGLTLNTSLLTSIAGGVTTYLLLLLQFLFIAHACDEKSGNTFVDLI